MDHTKTLRNLIVEHGLGERYTWLDGLSYTEAFLVCVGAGPWKYKRRSTIQAQAIAWAAGRDLGSFDENAPFPLVWQKSFTESMQWTLRRTKRTMDQFCEELRAQEKPQDARRFLYHAADAPNGAKCLALFVRDKLRAPAFPIDRHVRRILEANRLPAREDELLDLCSQIHCDPCAVATMMIRIATGDAAGEFNPTHASWA